MIEAGLVEDCDAKVFFLSIRLGHLHEGIDLANRRDVVRNEWPELRVEFNLLRLVPLYILEHLLKFF